MLGRYWHFLGLVLAKAWYGRDSSSFILDSFDSCFWSPFVNARHQLL